VNETLYWALVTFIFFTIEMIRDVIKLRVDIRNVYLVFGFTLFYFLTNTSFLMLIALIVAGIIIKKTTKVLMTEADQIGLLTLMMGHFVSGTLLPFLFVFISMFLATQAVAYLKGKKAELPGFALLAISHILTLPLLFY